MRFGMRYGKPKIAALAGTAVHTDLTTMALDNFCRDIQPQSEAGIFLAIGIDPVITLEDLLL